MGGEPNVIGCEAALVNGLETVFQTTEISIYIVRSEGEAQAALFCHADNLHTGDAVAGIDLKRNVILLQHVKNPVHTFVRPKGVVVGLHLIG